MRMMQDLILELGEAKIIDIHCFILLYIHSILEQGGVVRGTKTAIKKRSNPASHVREDKQLVNGRKKINSNYYIR